MSHESLNPWMLATIGILLVGTTVGVTMLQDGNQRLRLLNPQRRESVKRKAPVTQNVGSAKVIRVKNQRTTAQPAQSIIATCNKYADDQVNSKTEEVLTSAAMGAAIGAAVGAAGGAIAGRGNAGKGAAIGGLTGAAGGSLYGLNESKSHDARYQAAYLLACAQRVTGLISLHLHFDGLVNSSREETRFMKAPSICVALCAIILLVGCGSRSIPDKAAHSNRSVHINGSQGSSLSRKARQSWRISKRAVRNRNF